MSLFSVAIVLLVIASLVVVIFAIEKMNGCHYKQVNKYDVRFNGEHLTGHVLVIDERSEEQKSRNTASGKLDGDVVVFFHGHGQLPRFGYSFSSLLAKKSSSGIVIIPHVYTPHGKDSRLRGDQGKLIILRALVEQSLSDLNIRSVFPLETINIELSSKKGDEFIARKSVNMKEDAPSSIVSTITAVGWSHGGLLARQFAHQYPAVVKNLAQITPAGYESWGHHKWAGLNLTLNFLIEVALISTMVFRGQVKHPLIAGWAILRGTIGDSMNALLHFFKGWKHPGKLARAYNDIAQCSIVADDNNLPVKGLDNIVVLYGEKDSVFEAKNALPGVDLSQHEVAEKRLFEKFYPSALLEGTRCSFGLLPGNHIAPMVYEQEYVTHILRGTNQHA